MKSLFRHIKMIAAEVPAAVVLFSSGKDSIAMLDLCIEHFGRERLKVVHLFFVKGLSWREAIFQHYEKRYNITIDQFPQVDVANILRKQAFSGAGWCGRKLRQGDMESFLRSKYNVNYLLYGYKKTDSLMRQGMLKVIDGIDYRNKKAYPLSEWNEKDALNYCRQKKLPLPADYNMGFRDVNMFEGDALAWVYYNHPADYRKIKATYPFIDAEMIRNEAKQI
jgi:sulfate adenylyltransferase subunit 2